MWEGGDARAWRTFEDALSEPRNVSLGIDMIGARGEREDRAATGGGLSFIAVGSNGAEGGKVVGVAGVVVVETD